MTRQKWCIVNAITFGAPVVINNQRGNVAVVVRQEGENYYKVHRILTPDGKSFELNKNRDISETAGGVENNSSLSPTDNISMDSIAQEGEISQYSDRDNVSVYDLMGQNKELQKQNTKLEEDVSRLKERLKLEKQVTKGNTFNANQLRSVAKHLRNSAGSTYNEDALVGELKEVYSYIAESPQVDWTDLMAKCYEVARNVLDESKGYKVTNDYFKSVLDDIRKARITLSDEQIQEAKSAYGARYRDAFMGRIMLTKNGTSLG